MNQKKKSQTLHTKTSLTNENSLISRKKFQLIFEKDLNDSDCRQYQPKDEAYYQRLMDEVKEMKEKKIFQQDPEVITKRPQKLLATSRQQPQKRRIRSNSFGLIQKPFWTLLSRQSIKMLKKEKNKMRGYSCYCPDCGSLTNKIKLSKIFPIQNFTKNEHKLKVRSRFRVAIFAVLIAITYRKYIKKIVKKIRRISKVNHVTQRQSQHQIQINPIQLQPQQQPQHQSNQQSIQQQAKVIESDEESLQLPKIKQNSKTKTSLYFKKSFVGQNRIIDDYLQCKEQKKTSDHKQSFGTLDQFHDNFLKNKQQDKTSEYLTLPPRPMTKIKQKSVGAIPKTIGNSSKNETFKKRSHLNHSIGVPDFEGKSSSRNSFRTGRGAELKQICNFNSIKRNSKSREYLNKI